MESLGGYKGKKVVFRVDDILPIICREKCSEIQALRIALNF